MDIPSESRHEAEIREHLRSLVPTPTSPSSRATRRSCGRVSAVPTPLLVLAGHYDTVPVQGNLPRADRRRLGARLRGERHEGRVAVAPELVRDLADGDPGRRRAAPLRPRGAPAAGQPSPALFAGTPLVHEADLALLLEPTDLTIQAGCVGNLSARVTFHGVAAPARPWLADNAVHRAVEGLAEVVRHDRREAVVDGSVLRGRLRHAPRRARRTTSSPAARSRRSPLPARPVAGRREARPLARAGGCDGRDRRHSPPADVVVDAPLVRRLRELGDLPVEPKQAWTNVADFTARGIPAVNLGLGDPATRTPPTSRWTSPRSSGRTSSCATSSKRRPDAPSLPSSRRRRRTVRAAQLQAAEERLAQGLEVIDLDGRSSEPTDPAIIQALRDGVREHGLHLPPWGSPSSARRFALGRPPLRRRARPRRRGDPRRSARRCDLLVRAGRPRRRADATRSSSRSPSPVPAARGLRRRPRRGSSRSSSATLPARPRRPFPTTSGAHGARLAQHAEQPHRRWPPSPGASTTWRGSRASAPSCWPRTRPTRAVVQRAAALGPQLDDRDEGVVVFNTPRSARTMTGFAAGSSPAIRRSSTRCAASGRTSAPHRRSSCSVRRSSHGTARSTSSEPDRPTHGSGRCSSTCSAARACATQAARRRCTSGSPCRRARARRRMLRGSSNVACS